MDAVVDPSKSCSMHDRLSSLWDSSGRGEEMLEGVGGSLHSEGDGDPDGDVDDFLSRVFWCVFICLLR